VHRPCEVTKVLQGADGAELALADGRTLRADWVVGADGMDSTVRQAADIGFTGGSYQAGFVLADVVMDWAPGPEEVSLTFDAQGLTVVAPLPGDRYRVVATVDQAPDAPGLDFISDLLRHRAPGQARLHDLVWSSRFQVHHRVADRFRAGRLLLVGDAAHVHSPAGGQGMNTGIQDAHALGLVLTTGNLNRYEAVRRPVALRVVAFTDKLTRIATVRNPLARTLRNLALPVLGRIPAFRTRITTELAELTYR
jgi:2-polyprenyl-6-methoxyphenol hydroxylase-like FAD-dependent oxidoreductase